MSVILYIFFFIFVKRDSLIKVRCINIRDIFTCTVIPGITNYVITIFLLGCWQSLGGQSVAEKTYYSIIIITQCRRARQPGPHHTVGGRRECRETVIMEITFQTLFILLLTFYTSLATLFFAILLLIICNTRFIINKRFSL